MSPFNKAWNILKNDDERPNPESFRPPQDAFGALRNNPRFMDAIGENGENLSAINPNMHECKNCGGRTNIDREDVWSDDFCSKRCEQGENPTCMELEGRPCDFRLAGVQYDRYQSRDQGMRTYSVDIECPKCQHSMSGWVHE